MIQNIMISISKMLEAKYFFGRCNIYDWSKMNAGVKMNKFFQNIYEMNLIKEYVKIVMQR